MEVTLAQLDDLPCLLEIRYDSILAAAPAHYTMREVKTYLQDVDLYEYREMIAAQHVFVIKEHAILATAGWHKGYLRHVHVNPQHSNKGLGSALVKHVENNFVSAGGTLLKAGTTVYTASFYRKLGYQTGVEAKDWDGSCYYQIEKNLLNS